MDPELWQEFLLLRVVKEWNTISDRLSDDNVRKRTRILAQKVEDRYVVKAWKSWRKFITKLREKRLFVRKKQSQIRSEVCDLALAILQIWQEYTRDRRNASDTGLLVTARKRGKTLNEAWHAWKTAFKASRQAHIASFVYPFRYWRRWAREEYQFSTLKIRARMMGTKSTLRFAFRHFVEAVQFVEDARESKAEIQRSNRYVKLRRLAWTGWQQIRPRIHARWLRPRRHYVESLLRKSLTVLKYFVIRRAQLKATQQIATEKIRIIRLGLITRWWDNIQERKYWRETCNEKIQSFKTNTKHRNTSERTFLAWRDCVSARLDARRRVREFQKKYILQPVFTEGFVRFTRDTHVLRSQKTLAASEFYYSRRFRYCFLYSWEAVARALKIDRMRNNKALQRWYVTMIFRALLSWRKWFQERKRKNERYKEAFHSYVEGIRGKLLCQILRKDVELAERERVDLRAKFEEKWESDNTLARKFADRWMRNTGTNNQDDIPMDMG